MSTSITRSGNTQRIRLVAAEEAKATGKTDAQQLLANIALPDDEENSASAFLHVQLVEFISLALDNRFEEWSNRLAGFCDVIGPVLQRTQALEAKCALLSASLNQADCLAKITADAADVQLVMLSKATWGAFPVTAAGQTKDSTAQRRLQLQSYIEDGLHAAGVPVAEYPYITAARWAKGTLDPGMVGSHPMKELERWVFEDSGWGIEPVMETLEVPEKDGKEAHEITRRVIYRYPVLALCAIAAQAVGIDAGVPLNAARKELVRGAGNAMIQYPSGLKLAV